MSEEETYQGRVMPDLDQLRGHPGSEFLVPLQRAPCQGTSCTHTVEEFIATQSDCGERRSDRIGDADVLPVCGGGIVEGEQARVILGPALGGLGVFRPVPGEQALGSAPIRGHVNAFALRVHRQPLLRHRPIW